MPAHARLAVKRGARSTVLLCLVALASVKVATATTDTRAAAAPPPFLLASQLQRSLLTTRDGVPYPIAAMAEDKDGYLWLGGPTGLYRFDGVRFEQMFKDQNLPGPITALYEDNDGSLWVGSQHGLVSRIHHGVAAPIRHEIAKSTVLSFRRMADGTFWMATYRGAERLVHGTWQRAGPADALDAKNIMVTGTGVDGSYWLFDRDAAYRLQPFAHRFERYSVMEGIAAMASLPVSDALAGDQPVADRIVDRYGALWIPTDGKLVRVHAQRGSGTAPLITEKIGSGSFYADIQVTADLVDRQGNVWIATSEGLERFGATPFVPLALPLPSYWPLLAEDGSGALWVASPSATVPMSVTGTAKVHAEIGTGTTCISSGADGSVWFGNQRGFQHLQGKQLGTIPAPPSPEMPGTVPRCTAMHATADGALWVSLEHAGVWQWNGQRWNRVEAESADSIQSEGAVIWMAFDSGRLVSVERGRATDHDRDTGLDLGALTKLDAGVSGLWVAGTRGVAVRTGATFHRVSGRDGESFANASDIVQLPNGDLWMALPDGVYRIAAAEIGAALANAAHHVSYRRFDRVDGVDHAKYLLASRDGRLWAAMQHRIVWIDPLKVDDVPAPPTVAIDTINDQDLRFTGVATPELSGGTRAVALSFTAATLFAPAKTRFRYLLMGVDDDWQLSGDQREARYASLRPGRYTFLVEASDTAGNWADRPSRVSFRILPEWYQTWWFRTLCAAMALAILWLVHALRLRQIYNRLETRTRERESMARDFHDTILQNFQSLLLHVQLAVQSIPEGAPRQKLDKALTVTESALNEGRDKIGELRSLAEPLEDLAADIAHLASRLGEMYPTTFSMHVEGEPRSLVASVASDVHAMVGELVTNAFRHSQADATHVELRYGRRALDITVIDDGSGTDLSTQAPEKSGHWGLQGIRERVRRVGGRFVIGEAPSGKGTRANLRIPARYVYASRRWFRR
jgi:signal transduction histidine kinase/ligand-binding sensor domain-containing protein